MTPSLVCEGGLASGILADDSSLGLKEEMASASAVGDSTWLWLESVGDSSSLELEGGLRCY